MIAVTAWEWGAYIGAMALGTLLSGVFSGMETGIYVTNKIRLDLHAEAGRRPARRLRRLMRNPSNLMAVLLVGVNIAGYLTTFAVGSLLFRLGVAHDRIEWGTMALTVPLLFIFGESVPKNVFQRLGETLLYRVAWLLAGANFLLNACLLAPLVRGFGSLLTLIAGRGTGSPFGHEGLAAVVHEGHASGVLTLFQSRMAERVMSLAEVTLADVMLPLRQAVTAPAFADREQLMALLRRHDFSRFPLLDEEGRVIGVLDIYSFLAAEGGRKPADVFTPPLVLPCRMNVSDALYRMQRQGAAMIVVQDSAGRHVGIATVKDLVEEIVGELEEW